MAVIASNNCSTGCLTRQKRQHGHSYRAEPNKRNNSQAWTHHPQELLT